MDPDEMTTAEVAAELGVSRSTISRLKRDVLPYRQIGDKGHRYYRREHVEAYRAHMFEAPAPSDLVMRVARLEERMDAHEAGHQQA